jgi:hypothetical protein
MKSVRVSQAKKFARKRRFGRAQWDHLLDPYKQIHKVEEPAVCPQCGVVFHAGRWQWIKRPKDAREVLCPACHRISVRFPAGVVTLAGPMVAANKAEMTRIARNQEKAIRQEHPLNRIMSISEGPDELVISTTDIHLPSQIGKAIKRAFHGKLHVQFDGNSYFVRAHWHREA